MVENVSEFDKGILENFRIRPENYFGIADWEKLAKEWNFKVSFPETFRVATLRELDAIIPGKRKISFRESLDKGDSFVFLIPEKLPSLFKTGSPKKVAPGFYIIDYGRSRPSRIGRHCADPKISLAAVLWSVKKQSLKEKLSFVDREEMTSLLVVDSHVTFFSEYVPARLFGGIIMPMDR